MNNPAQAFPVLSTDGLVVLIDDDEGFLETLQDMLSTDHRVVGFTEPAALHRFLRDRVKLLARERLALADLWRAQVGAEGTAALEALRFFARPERFDAPLVLVTDYAMPLETGLSVCSAYDNTGLRRILLTGVADSRIAIGAFNAGTIEHFVEKQGSRFPASLVEAVRAQLAASAQARSAPLAAQVPPELAGALAQPQVRGRLASLLQECRVQEYLLLGEPQGLVAVTREGQALWIQLETQGSLEELQDVLELAGVQAGARGRVAQRRSLVAVGWMQQIGAAPCEADAIALGAEPLLLAAVFPLDLPQALRPATPPDAP